MRQKTGENLEVKLQQLNKCEIVRRDYFASGSWETFLSVEQPGKLGISPPVLIGLLRLRKMP